MLARIKSSGLRWLWLAFLLVILDQWTKLWADQALQAGRIIEVMPHFNLRLAYNEGAAFSFLANAGGWQMGILAAFALIVSVVLVVWMSRLTRQERWLAISLSLILSGAIGNLIDRISYGHVIDFIDWFIEGYHWPTFNIADCAISLGAVMLLIESLFLQPKTPKHDKKNSKKKDT